MVNSTVKDIADLIINGTAYLTEPFNNLYNDVYSHFDESQNSLRIARQDFYKSAATFPWYKLTSGTRSALMWKIVVIIFNCIDPTVDFLQRYSMLRFVYFTNGKSTAIEDKVKPAVDQLIELQNAVRRVKNNVCLANLQLTSSKLIEEYSNFTKALNTCAKNATIAYEPHFEEFNKLLLASLPLINGMNEELINCENGQPDTETCVKVWLAQFCINATTTCTDCKTM